MTKHIKDIDSESIQKMGLLQGLFPDVSHHQQ